ncbi:tyrosine protein kinase, putative [Trypanosoma cruzi marinkellei]|uniref:Tyrosine protein kinase, putative n=1 Tax=Trypanosoma cruzi marinkellei TaxID=85056 RepID=K2NKL3_TRYCR|nr:tyrosine protein kinase, putative [Trypanosoma cruzi marinkellei]
MEESHPSELQLPARDGDALKGDGDDGGGEGDAVGCTQEAGRAELLEYKVHWDQVVGERSFGVIYRGRHVSNGTEVGVLTLTGRLELREELRKEAEKGVILLLNQWPGIIQHLGTFDIIEKDTVTVMSMLQLRGVEDMQAFFTRDVTQKEEGKGKGELEDDPASIAPEQSSSFTGCCGAEESVCSHPFNENAAKGKREEEEEEEKDKGEAETHRAEETKYAASAAATGEKTQSLLPPALLTQRQGGALSVGKYMVQLGSVLGRGKFGTVYRGWHREEGYEVAVKILKGPVSKRAKMLIEPRELGRLQKLDHPNILRMFGAFRHEEKDRNEMTLALVLEFCHGGDLKEFLARNDPLSERQAKHIMRQLVDFLCFLKSNRMMHRDLKPANILLTATNIDRAVIKVADWGMAKQISTLGSSICVPDANVMFESAVGTVAYMSPERLSRELYDFQAEVWALGVIMYELLFARHPYLHSASSVRTPEELLNAITRAEELEMSCNVPRSDTKRKGGNVFKQHQSEVNPFSRECYELMRHILDPDSKTRYTIEQVRAHPWISQPEKMRATEEVKAVTNTVEPAVANEEKLNTAKVIKAEDVVAATIKVIKAEESVTTELVATVSSTGVTGIPLRVPSSEEEVAGPLHVQGLGSNWSALQRQQLIYQAFREYFYILRYDVLEAESDPGRGLVLLSYTWELLRAVARAAALEEHRLSGGTVGLDASSNICHSARSSTRFALPDDIKLMENYIHETAQRLKRNLPCLTTHISMGAETLKFSTGSICGMEASGESLTPLPANPQKLTYPSAHTLLFQRTVSLIRAAATEELMLSDSHEQDNVMEEEEVRPEGERYRQKRMYEKAIAILRLILQQVVVRCQSSLHYPFPPVGTDTEESNGMQVLTIPLVPLEDEADQRTVQALLHTVEKHYRRLVKMK